ncbi:MAG: hypothetical protein RL042_120 [Nitrospirota bacterium]|jgi:hypothetical protein
MDILYHYCSTASFHAIVQSHALWLSSLSLSNDTMEGKLVASAIGRLAERESLSEDAVRRIQGNIGFFEEHIDGLGFCLSEDGDLLSQWRGYAENATGVAIGFSSDYLNWRSTASLGRTEPGFTLQNVDYESSAHEALVEPTYRKVMQLIEAGAFKTLDMGGLVNTIGLTDQELEQRATAIREVSLELYQVFIPLIPQLFRLKAYAFREEREWRLLSYLVKAGAEACSHRVAGSRIIPYRKVELGELERSPIVEVILGPKHGTPPKIVEDFLKLNHYGRVKVRRSAASYR